MEERRSCCYRRHCLSWLLLTADGEADAIPYSTCAIIKPKVPRGFTPLQGSGPPGWSCAGSTYQFPHAKHDILMNIGAGQDRFKFLGIMINGGVSTGDQLPPPGDPEGLSLHWQVPPPPTPPLLHSRLAASACEAKPCSIILHRIPSKTVGQNLRLPH